VVSVSLRFKSGLTGYVNAILATPHHCRLHVYGSEAWVEALNATHPDTPGPTELTICRKGGQPETHDYAWTDTVRANLEAFADAVAGRAEYPYSDFEKLHNVSVLEAVTRSVATGAAIALADQ
jgi:predicted dehydrogenase